MRGGKLPFLLLNNPHRSHLSTVVLHINVHIHLGSILGLPNSGKLAYIYIYIAIYMRSSKHAHWEPIDEKAGTFIHQKGQWIHSVPAVKGL